MTRFVVGLGILLVLIGFALGFTIWNLRSDESSRDRGNRGAPASSSRSLGASTLSHGGPTPSRASPDHESGPVAGPFLKPAGRAPSDASGAQEAGGEAPTNRSPRAGGPRRGPGGRGP